MLDLTLRKSRPARQAERRPTGFWTSAMDDVRALAVLLQPRLKPNRGRTPEVAYVMAAILLARNPHLGGRGACRLVDGADENAGHSRVSSLAAKVQSILAAADDNIPPALLPTPVPPVEHDGGLQVVNGNEEVRSQLWRRRVDDAMCLPDYATFHLDAAQTGEMQPPAPPQQSAQPPAPQLDYFADELAKLAELNTQVDEDEFKSAISRALSRAGAHVSVEHQERGRPHVHILITLPWRFSDGSEPRLYDGPSVS